MGIEPTISCLRTSALPLSYGAVVAWSKGGATLDKVDIVALERCGREEGAVRGGRESIAKEKGSPGKTSGERARSTATEAATTAAKRNGREVGKKRARHRTAKAATCRREGRRNSSGKRGVDRKGKREKKKKGKSSKERGRHIHYRLGRWENPKPLTG